MKNTPMLLFPFLASLPVVTAQAWPGGAFDTTFGNGGYRFVDFSVATNRWEVDAGLSVMTDRKIVTVGNLRDPLEVSPSQIGIARLLPDGQPDPGFGGGDGMLVLVPATFGPGSDARIHAANVAVQADGKIIVVGSQFNDYSDGRDLLILRVLADGSGLDPSFSDDGFLGYATNGIEQAYDVANAVAIQADGKILVAGSTGLAWPGDPDDGDILVLRLLGDGRLDSAFGAAGKQRITYASPPQRSFDRAHSIGLQSDGKIVIGGETSALLPYAQDAETAVVRLTANGQFDAGFGNHLPGRSSFDLVPGKSEYLRGMAISELAERNPAVNRRIVVSVRPTLQPPDLATVAVIDNTGYTDPSFSTDGKRTLPLFATDYVADNLVVQTRTTGDRMNPVQTRAIVVAGQYTTAPPRYALVRVDFSGFLDTSFGNGGLSGFRPDFGGDPNAPLYGIDLLARQGNDLIFGSWEMDRLSLGRVAPNTDLVIGRVRGD